MHQAPPMPRGLNFPPGNQGQDLPTPPEPTRADLRRSLITELSIEMEQLERSHDMHKKELGHIFETTWDEMFGKDVFPGTRKFFKMKLGI